MATARAARRLRLTIALTIFAAAGALGLFSERGPAPLRAAQKEQPAAKEIDPVNPKPGDAVLTGFVTCRGCHNETLPINPKNNDFANLYKSHEFILLNEGQTWKQQDPHSAAFKVLSGDLGKQMSGILKYDVTKAPQCLTCHAIDKYPGTPLPKEEAEVTKRFVRVLTEGVDCQACHGLRSPWQSKHYQPEGDTIPWRIMTPADKEKEGMRNLRDPVVKAKLCASCHVGDPDVHRVVTHEMYAAGHPPLPPFELGSFMLSEPMHWGSPSGAAKYVGNKKDAKDAKDAVVLKFFTEAEFTKYAGGKAIAEKNPNWMWELYRTHPEAKEVALARAISAGAIASLHAEMKLIAADAAAVASGDEGIVDFARFDCYACHHDLKYPSPRQARGYAGVPGRPPLKAWVTALPGVVADHAATLQPLADEAKGFGQRWSAVQSAALARPFGKPKELAATAADMARWCEAFLKENQKTATPLYSPEEAKKLLAKIGEAAVKKWSADPEAAMHLTWAYIALRKHTNDPIPAKTLADLRMVVPVQVRQPREVMGKPTFSTEKGEPMTVGDTLRERLDLFNNFKPDDYNRTFGGIVGNGKKP